MILARRNPAVSQTIPVAQRFDTAKIVRDYVHDIIGTAPNHATPETWIEVLNDLDDLTVRLEAEDKVRRAMTIGMAPERVVEKDQITTDLERWRARLDHYGLLASSAPPGDRKAVLWEVTAPLLLGWHGGPDGRIALAPGGYPPGFRVSADPVGGRRPPDIGTPFTIANQLGIWEDWKVRRFELLVSDLKENAVGVVEGAVKFVTRPGGVPIWLAIGGGVFAYLIYKQATK